MWTNGEVGFCHSLVQINQYKNPPNVGVTSKYSDTIRADYSLCLGERLYQLHIGEIITLTQTK